MGFDMLVPLYGTDWAQRLRDLRLPEGVTVQRAMHLDRDLIAAYVAERFNGGWRSEVKGAFTRQPPTLFVAEKDGRPVGFAAYDSTAKGYFGPTGVSEELRGNGIGTALLLACLNAMKEEGYAYTVIGWVSDAKVFYEKTVGAVVIPDSHPGVYARKLGVPKPGAGGVL